MKSPARDPHFATNSVHGYWAQEPLIKRVLSFVPQRRAAVDVGAHIGVWTQMLAAQFKQVYAFEPVAENFECLRANVDQPNVHLHAVALGAGCGFCDLTLPTGGNSGTWRTKHRVGETLVVPLDAHGLLDVDLIKIDTEGTEGEVLQGARELLERCHPHVFFEDNGLGQKYFGKDWANPRSVLEEFAYVRIARLQKNELWAPKLSR